MPDRYGDAVRARRIELRAEQGPLSGTHRAELRAEVALARVRAADAAAAAFSDLAREARSHACHPDRAVRRSLAATLPAALDAIAGQAHAAALAALAPALRRIAASRRLDLAPRWPTLPAPRLPLLADAAPGPARAPRLAGAAEGLAVWRVALVVVAAMPLVGLPVLGGPALAPVAVGVGAAAVAVAVRSRRSAVERAVVQRQVDRVLAEGRSALRVDVERMLLELERSAAATLDAAVERRRTAVEAELLALAGQREVGRV
ncbi:MAG TPA: hypothetical protein VGE11_23080 [Pseudonocardia sp.]